MNLGQGGRRGHRRPPALARRPALGRRQQLHAGPRRPARRWWRRSTRLGAPPRRVRGRGRRRDARSGSPSPPGRSPPVAAILVADRLRRRRDEAQAYLKGVRSVISGDPDAAIEALSDAARLGSPEAVETYLALGALFRREGDLARAVRLHRNMLLGPALDPARRAEVERELAEDYRRSGMLAEAAEIYERLAAAGDAAAAEGLRDVRVDQGDLAAAVAVQRRCRGPAGSGPRAPARGAEPRGRARATAPPAPRSRPEALAADPAERRRAARARRRPPAPAGDARRRARRGRARARRGPSVGDPRLAGARRGRRRRGRGVRCARGSPRPPEDAALHLLHGRALRRAGRVRRRARDAAARARARPDRRGDPRPARAPARGARPPAPDDLAARHDLLVAALLRRGAAARAARGAARSAPPAPGAAGAAGRSIRIPERARRRAASQRRGLASGRRPRYSARSHGPRSRGRHLPPGARARGAPRGAGPPWRRPSPSRRRATREHGDFAVNAAMVLAEGRRQAAARARRRPSSRRSARWTTARDIASLEIAGPGFVNVRLAPGASGCARSSGPSRSGAAYGRTEVGKGKRVIVEYVSANPTGPMHVGHGRNAVVGDGVQSLLRWAGFDVDPRVLRQRLRRPGADPGALGPPALPGAPRPRGHDAAEELSRAST